MAGQGCCSLVAVMGCDVRNDKYATVLALVLQ
jgi:hypothetical protein